MAAPETSKPVVAAQPAQTPPPPLETKPVPDPASVKMPIRINAGSGSAQTNANSEIWLADTGFDGGDSVERGGDVKIENTGMPAVYRSEHHSMTGFSMKVPNGKY